MTLINDDNIRDNLKYNLVFQNLKTLLHVFPIQKLFLFNKCFAIVVNQNLLSDFIFFLKHHTLYQFRILTCISGVDNPDKKKRFSLVYELLSIRFNNRLRIKIFLDEINCTDSIVGIFSNANWFECEIWDMFGIFFRNHPNLKRILTDYGFSGNPLRKDFPLSGFLEINYSESEKRIVSNPVSLSQEYRSFEYDIPWKNF